MWSGKRLMSAVPNASGLRVSSGYTTHDGYKGKLSKKITCLFNPLYDF